MTKHTPGPWAVVGQNGVKIGGYMVGVGNDADAPLIASAPDLLAALKALLGMGGWEAQCWKDAQAAIAKAEGRTL